MPSIEKIRVSAKAVIIRDGELLTTVNHYEGEEPFRLLPGGGQEPGEPLEDAVRRECREEIGCDVSVGELLFVRDYIGSNHRFASRQSHLHQVEIMFSCSLPTGAEPRLTGEGDDFQTGVAWVPLDRLEEERFFPRALAPRLRALAAGRKEPGYLGAVN